MKIGVFLGETDASIGGGFTYQDNIICELNKINNTHHRFILFSYSSDILCKINKTSFIDTCKLEEPVYRPGMKEKILNRIRPAVISLPSELEKKSKEFGIKMLWYTNWMCETHEIPYIYTVYDLQHRLQPFFPEVSAKGAWDFRENTFKKAIQRATYVLTGTQRGLQEIHDFFNVPVERIRILPLPSPSLGLNENSVSGFHDRIKILGLSPGYIFYPAQFWAHKNHIVILKALLCLQKKHNLNFTAVFTGSDKGNKNYLVKKCREYGLNDKVKFTGFVPADDLVALYKNAFALVFPTFFGPDNLPPLEAFTLGCPVIAPNVPGSEEQLGDAALLFKPSNENELAEQITKLYQAPSLREDLIKKGYERAKKYAPSNYMADILSLLNEFEPIRDCWE